MNSHSLLLKRDPQGGSWLLEWDESTFLLVDPSGRPTIDVPVTSAYRLLDPFELLMSGEITIGSPGESVSFQPKRPALAGLRALVAVGLRSDGEYREEIRRRARRSLLVGPIMSAVSGGLFATYCWWASWAPEPPPGHWMHVVGPLIKLSLTFLLAGILAGVCVFASGVMLSLQIRRIERAMDEDLFG